MMKRPAKGAACRRSGWRRSRPLGRSRSTGRGAGLHPSSVRKENQPHVRSGKGRHKPCSEPADLENEDEDRQDPKNNHGDLQEGHDLLSEAQLVPRRRITRHPEMADLRHDLLETHDGQHEASGISRSANGLRSAWKPLHVVALDHVGHPDHVRQPPEAKEAEGEQVEQSDEGLTEVEAMPSEPAEEEAEDVRFTERSLARMAHLMGDQAILEPRRLDEGRRGRRRHGGHHRGGHVVLVDHVTDVNVAGHGAVLQQGLLRRTGFRRRRRGLHAAFFGHEATSCAQNVTVWLLAGQHWSTALHDPKARPAN